MCENKVFDVHIQKLLKFLIHLSGLIYCAICMGGCFIWERGGVYMIMTSPLAIASLIKIFGAVIFQSKSVPYTIDQKACMMHISLHYTGASQDSDAAFPTNFFVNK